jgi:hypothetical protein
VLTGVQPRTVTRATYIQSTYTKLFIKIYFNITFLSVPTILKPFPSVHLSDQNDTDNFSSLRLGTLSSSSPPPPTDLITLIIVGTEN